MDIKKNILKWTQTLPEGCTLIAVTKTHPVETILEAYDASHRAFGENKAQELVRKYEELPKDIQWHMIGHLQTNKVKYIAPFVHLIHSVDSLKLLSEIDKQAQKFRRTIPCLLQVHIAREATKFGFSQQEITELLKKDELKKFSNIRIIGLMGMATLTENPEEVRQEFKNLKRFFDHLKSLDLPENVEMKELSIGMSGDYQIAMEEGSTIVRIGSAIFGERKQTI